MSRVRERPHRSGPSFYFRKGNPYTAMEHIPRMHSQVSPTNLYIFVFVSLQLFAKSVHLAPSEHKKSIIEMTL